MATHSDLEKITPPKGLPAVERDALFQHIMQRLGSYRSTLELYSLTECRLSPLTPPRKVQRQNAFNQDVRRWAQSVLEHAWAVLDESGGGKRP